jgi:hypothetical protein
LRSDESGHWDEPESQRAEGELLTSPRNSRDSTGYAVLPVAFAPTPATLAALLVMLGALASCGGRFETHPHLDSGGPSADSLTDSPGGDSTRNGDAVLDGSLVEGGSRGCRGLSCSPDAEDGPPLVSDGQAGVLSTAYTLAQHRNFASPLPNATGITYDGQELWILAPASGATQDTLVRFNPDSLSMDRAFTLTGLRTPGAGPDGITWDGRAIWITVAGEAYNALLRADPTTGQITKTMPSPTILGPSDLDFDGSQLWLSTGTGDVYRIDPVSGGITQRFSTAPQSGGHDHGIAFRTGELWVGDFFGGIEVHDAATGAPIGNAVHADGSAFTGYEVGPSCFVGSQLVMLGTHGITYYDATKVL